MIKGKYSWWLLPVLMCLLTACGDDDDYYYPSVKLEYLTAFSGANGDLQTILTDDGKSYPVVDDATKTHINANSSIRLVSNYGTMNTTDGTAGVKLYATLQAVSPLPMPADKFKDGVKTDPAEVQAIWLGLNYLNITLEIKSQQGKHQFGFIEDKVVVDSATRTSNVYITLYHNAGNDVQAYTQRAYLSMPLAHYATGAIRNVVVHFSLHTYSGTVKTYSFTYVTK